MNACPTSMLSQHIHIRECSIEAKQRLPPHQHLNRYTFHHTPRFSWWVHTSFINIWWKWPGDSIPQLHDSQQLVFQGWHACSNTEQILRMLWHSSYKRTHYSIWHSNDNDNVASRIITHIIKLQDSISWGISPWNRFQITKKLFQIKQGRKCLTKTEQASQYNSSWTVCMHCHDHKYINKADHGHIPVVRMKMQGVPGLRSLKTSTRFHGGGSVKLFPSLAPTYICAAIVSFSSRSTFTIIRCWNSFR